LVEGGGKTEILIVIEKKTNHSSYQLSRTNSEKDSCLFKQSSLPTAKILWQAKFDQQKFST
jgi:hypothetical protein